MKSLVVNRDNWGWRARFGMFIVSNEAVPEAEWWAMMPPDMSVHAARITAPAPWASWDEKRNAVTLADDLVRGAEQFAAMRLNAVVLGHSSSSILGGTGWDEAVVDAVAKILPTQIAVTTNGMDCVAALNASGIEKPFLAVPPWFGESFLEPTENYFAQRGFSPAGSMRVDPGPNWRDVPPEQLYPQGMGFEQDVESLYQQICHACPESADGVFIVGTGFRCVGICQALEQALKRPVITANQASLWHCLRLAGIDIALPGYGNLFKLAKK
jgi:maleate isomerase